MKNIVIIDIDGTVALRNDRAPFDWNLIHLDSPNLNIIEVVRILSNSGLEIVYMTGREEKLRAETEHWLNVHVSVPGILLMRVDKDRRKDDVVKLELFERNIHDPQKVLVVLDDRKSVVRMWREQLKLTCLQVAPGDF